MGSKHVAILAGAGTGKTSRLIEDITKRIKSHDANPAQILALTFSRKATQELRQRLKDEIGSKAIPIIVSTFHAFAASLLRKHGIRLGFDAAFTVLHEGDIQPILRGVLSDEGVPNDQLKVKDAYEAIERFMNTGQWPELIGGHRRGKTIKKVYTSLQKKLRASNSMTFSGLIMYAAQLLETQPDIRKEYASRFQYIYVDEFQDTNIAQYKLLKLLAGEHTRLFVVGDDDQSIFSWRYVESRMIKRFLADFECEKRKPLVKNFRSTATIVKAANGLISHNIDREEKKLVPTRPAGELIRVHRRVKQEHEAKGIAEQIIELRIKAGGDETIAILCRHWELFKKIEKQLRIAKIKHHNFNPKSKLGKPEQSAAEYLDDIIDEKGNEAEVDKSAVHLMTIHSAKGLEFDHVFLPAWEEKRFPYSRSLNQEEERRLAYVAITRAKKQVFISNVLEKRDGLKSRIKIKTVKRSRFIKELPADCIKRTKSKKGTLWLKNQKEYIAPSWEIEIDDVVSHNAYYNKAGKRCNYGVGTVTAIMGDRIEMEIDTGEVVTVDKKTVTKAILPPKRRVKKPGSKKA